MPSAFYRRPVAVDRTGSRVQNDSCGAQDYSRSWRLSSASRH